MQEVSLLEALRGLEYNSLPDNWRVYTDILIGDRTEDLPGITVEDFNLNQGDENNSNYDFVAVKKFSKIVFLAIKSLRERHNSYHAESTYIQLLEERAYEFNINAFNRGAELGMTSIEVAHLGLHAISNANNLARDYLRSAEKISRSEPIDHINESNFHQRHLLWLRRTVDTFAATFDFYYIRTGDNGLALTDANDIMACYGRVLPTLGKSKSYIEKYLKTDLDHEVFHEIVLSTTYLMTHELLTRQLFRNKNLEKFHAGNDLTRLTRVLDLAEDLLLDYAKSSIATVQDVYLKLPENRIRVNKSNMRLFISLAYLSCQMISVVSQYEDLISAQDSTELVARKENIQKIVEIAIKVSETYRETLYGVAAKRNASITIEKASLRAAIEETQSSGIYAKIMTLLRESCTVADPKGLMRETAKLLVSLDEILMPTSVYKKSKRKTKERDK